MKEDIEKILDDSVTAPSPDNYQPWRFEVRGHTISVFKVPGLVNALLDCHEHVLLLTNGMLLENMVIASSARGYSATIRYFPDAGRPDCVAIVTLEPTGLAPDPLYAFLRKRCTNRKMYSKKKIDPSLLGELSGTAAGFPGMEITLVTDARQVKRLGKAVSVIDRVMFENKELHDSLFSHITWSRAEEQKTHVGLNLDSMEFNPPEKLMFRALKNWSVVKAFNRTGFSSFVRFKNGMQYGSAAASVLASVADETPEAYLLAGRCMQRFWLKATAQGLSLHPIVGVIYCYQKVVVERSDLFSPLHAQWLREEYDVLRTAAASKGPVVFFFRMGYASPTSYQSSRKRAEVQYL